MLTMAEFERTLADPEPPAGFDAALQAIWWASKGDWDRAHACAQQREGDPSCDLVHAHLHRREGDTSNAHFWYRRAAEPVPTLPVDEERAQIAAKLLRQTTHQQVA